MCFNFNSDYTAQRSLKGQMRLPKKNEFPAFLDFNTIFDACSAFWITGRRHLLCTRKLSYAHESFQHMFPTSKKICLVSLESSQNCLLNHLILRVRNLLCKCVPDESPPAPALACSDQFPPRCCLVYQITKVHSICMDQDAASSLISIKKST